MDAHNEIYSNLWLLFILRSQLKFKEMYEVEVERKFCFVDRLVVT